MELNKELLGEELFNQVQEKLGDKKAVILDDGQEIYNPKDGLYFPKAKWDEVNTSKNHLQTELSTLQTELATLKESAGSKGDYEKKLVELQTKMNENKTSFEAVELENKKKFALQLHLRDALAQHPELLENQFRAEDKWNFELDGDRIKDWDSILKPVQEKYSTEFGKTVKKGFNPDKGGVDGELFSLEEIKLLDDKQLSDPKILDKVNKSLETIGQ